MSGNKIVGLIRIGREGQVGGIDRSQADDEGALLCVRYCVTQTAVSCPVFFFGAQRIICLKFFFI